MKKTLLAAAAVACLMSTPAIAKHDRHTSGWDSHNNRPYEQSSTVVTVPVVNVNPQFRTSETRTPVQTCHEQMVPVTKNGDVLPGQILGGVVGGLLGNQIGGGTGKHVATGIGAVIGVITGGNLARGSGETHYEQRRVCNTTYHITHQQIPAGFLVVYQYEGVTYTTLMANDPGGSIRIRVQKSHTVE